MKTPVLEQSTLKWILAWLATCWIFFLGVFAADFVSFEGLKIVAPDRMLTQGQWNNLIDGVSGFTFQAKSDFIKYSVPAWTVIIYDWNWSGCPTGWSQWSWWGDWRFLMPLKPGEWTAPFDGWSKTFSIGIENMPKHSHAVLYGWNDNYSLNANSSLAYTNVSSTNNWDSDYTLVWSQNEANVWKSSEVWGGKAIEFMPPYKKVLFCIKNS